MCPRWFAAHAARARIADANQKMTRYRAAIDAGGDPEEIGTWISQAKAQRVQAETDLRNATASTRLTRRQIDDLIEGITDVAAVLADADPAKASDAYDKLGLRLTYHPEAQIVHAAANPQPGNIGNWYVSEGRVHLKANGCCRVRLSWSESWRERAIRWVDPADHDRICRDVGCDRGTVSYLHMHALVALHGQPDWVAALTPLSVDGMIVAASTTLLAESRSGSRGGFLPWALLIMGSVASLAANVTVAEPTVTGRMIAAWPSFALIGSYELLMRQVRRAAADSPPSARSQEAAASEPLPRNTAVAATSAAPSVRPVRAGSGIEARRDAGRWARANLGVDGSLPSGKVIGDRYGRHERWGRLVEAVGAAGEFG